MLNHLKSLVPAALYARVSSERQDVDLSITTQLRALRAWAKTNGYRITREFIDRAESGRIADRPQFTAMIDEANAPVPPFKVILVYKSSRFSRRREHAVSYKAMLKKRGIRVISITEPFDDSPTGNFYEGMLELIDEFHSAILSVEVKKGMAESARRGHFMGSRAPFGYQRVKVSDGQRDRPTLVEDAENSPVVTELFQRSALGEGLKSLCRDLNDRGISHKGQKWTKPSMYYLLTNEAYTGTAVWGVKAKRRDHTEPVRVEGAWPALVDQDLFNRVQEALKSRGPKGVETKQPGGKYLLAGLVRCGACGVVCIGQAAKSGLYSYYVCGTLHREGAGTCSQGRYVPVSELDTIVMNDISRRVATGDALSKLEAVVEAEAHQREEAMAGRLAAIDAELCDVEDKLTVHYQAMECKQLTLDALAPRIFSLRTRQDELLLRRESLLQTWTSHREPSLQKPAFSGLPGSSASLSRLGTSQFAKTLCGSSLRP